MNKHECRKKPSRRVFGIRVLIFVIISSLVGHWWCIRHSALAQAPKSAALFELRPGEHICIIGNTLADRMQHDGWLDTFLVTRFPKHDLVIRNLGFSADELNTRLRSMSFGTPDEWLKGEAPIPQPKKVNPNAPVLQNR